MKPATIARTIGTVVLAALALGAALTTGAIQAPQQADQAAAVVAPAVPTYTPEHSTTRNEAQCRAAAYVIYHTGVYSGTDTEVACFGAEDDPRVGLALDYGMTEAQYAEEEASQNGSYSNPYPGQSTCGMEDGSGPGQSFPCHWDAAAQGNGQGQSFTLWSAGGEPDYS